MNKYAVFAGLGDFYLKNRTGYSALNFSLQNITDFSAELRSIAWSNSPAMFDPTAEKNNIIKKLEETVNNFCTNDDDWLLFYYCGHASRLMVKNPNGTSRFITYCVTYSENLKIGFFPGLDQFFTQVDYNHIVDLFHQKVPKGHLITILDCCYAFGLVQNFADQKEFHSVIAASSAIEEAAYNANSSFFTAFNQCWELPFSQLSNQLKNLMSNMDSPNIAEVQIATNFINQSLKNSK